MSNLTADELKWLREVKDGGMMMKKLPEDAERRLLDLGLIEQKLGGTVITPKGVQALRK